MAVGAIEITPQQNLGGAVSFAVGTAPEEAGQNGIPSGTPCQIASDGGVQAWDGSTVAAGIAGIFTEQTNNLVSTGYGQPVGFSPVIGPGSYIGSYAANANQPLANITPPGVPFSDGTLNFFLPVPGTVFGAVIGTSAGTPAPIATAASQVGKTYGLTKDTNGYWYVDTNKTGGSAVLTVVAIDPREAVGTVGGVVWFTFLPAAAQLSA
jgi:hypothetical protein